MSFVQYIFSFLYVRNWHTGVRELSWRRLFWLGAVLGLVLFLIGLAWWLQKPAVYSVEPVGATVQNR